MVARVIWRCPRQAAEQQDMFVDSDAREGRVVSVAHPAPGSLSPRERRRVLRVSGFVSGNESYNITRNIYCTLNEQVW